MSKDEVVKQEGVEDAELFQPPKSVSDNTVEEEQEAVVEVSDEELMEQAKSMGWKPKEEMDDDDKEWVDYDEFVRRAPLFKRIEKLRKTTQKLKAALSDLSTHHNRMREDFQRQKELEIEQLNQLLDEATAQGDVQTSRNIRKNIQNAQKELEELPDESSIKDDLDAVYEDWVAENSWFNTEPEMKAYAQVVGSGFIAQNSENGVLKVPAEEVYEFVQNEVQSRFKDYFNKSKRQSTPVTTRSGPARRASSKKPTARDLNEAQKRVMTNLVRAGVMTEQEYIDDLAKAGALD